MNLDIRAKKEKLLKALLLQKAIKDRDRLKTYKPNPGAQERFFKSKKIIRLALSGNQFGKTHGACVETALYALGEHPHKKIRVPNVGIIVSAQGFQEGIVKTILPKLQSIVGSQDIKRIKQNSQGIPNKIIWRTGSVTYLMSAEQDDVAFEGVTVDYVYADEPMRRSIFIALKRGLMKAGGHFWMAATPLDEPWIYEELYLPGISGKDPNIEVFEGTPDENKFISDKDKMEFKSRLTADEIEARWFGRFRHLSGRVFKEYQPDKHLVPSFDIPNHWPVYIAIDPHRNKAHAVVFLAVSPQNKFYICNEIYVKCPILTLADHILDISAQYNVVMTLIDTSAQEDGWEKESARQILQRAGVRTRLAQKKNLKASGLMMINQYFASDNLFVMEHCHRMHREMTNQTFKKNKRDHQQILEEPEKKWDDASDALRYILVERPCYRARSQISEIGPIYCRGA